MPRASTRAWRSSYRRGRWREFGLARERAHAAENADDELLNAGYEALVGALQEEVAARAELTRVVEQLSALEASENAKFYGQQLQTALQIFQG